MSKNRMSKNRTFLLKELYQALWLSADFESDLAERFPLSFIMLKYHEDNIPEERLNEMYDFMRNHPVFI